MIDVSSIDLGKLSRGQRLQLEKAISELRRRELEEQIRTFRPISVDDINPNYPEMGCNDQWGFLHSEAKERWVFGGNRSGKTHIGVSDLLLFAMGQHPVRTAHRSPPVYIRCIGTSWEDGVKRVILKKFKEMVIRSDLKGGSWETAFSEKSRTLEFKNGSLISFLTAEQDVNKHAGDDIDAVGIDEHIAQKYYDENIMRLVDRNGYLIGMMTPEEGITWERDHVLYPPPGVNVEHWFFWLQKNPYLSPEGITSVMASITDPMLRRAKLFGEFVALTGMVYSQYRKDLLKVEDFEVPRHWSRVCIIDPHLRKFAAIVWLAWSPDGEAIIYRTRKVKMTVSDLAKYIRVQSAGEKIDLYIGDEAMGGDGKNIFGEESVLIGLQNNGIPVMPTNQSSDKTFEAGIEKVREYIKPDPISRTCDLKIFASLDTPPEYIDGKLTGSIFWEFDKYRFKKLQKSDEETFREKVATVDDDYLDCLRYGIMAGPQDIDQVINNRPYREVDSFTGW